MKEEIEIRAVSGHPGIETREDGQEYIVGEALSFNQRSQLLGWFVEQLDDRCLDECDMSDVVGLFNHDNNTILGRTLSSTLTLEKHSGGLRYKIPYDKNDPDHVRVLAKIKRGDVRGSSFAFSIAPGGSDWNTDPVTGVEVRTIKKIAILHDVSPVVNPAYLQTSAGIGKRSIDSLKEERDAFKAERDATAPPADESIANDAPDPGEAQAYAADLDLMDMQLCL